MSYDPVDTTDSRTVTWTVADENIVSIEKQGEHGQKAVITAKNGGTTTVTAKVGKYTKTATITVRIPMTEVKLNLEQNEMTLHKGEATQITTHYLPKNTTDRIEPVWTSEDESIAVVEDGMIIAKGVEVNYSLENMARFTYEEDNTTTAITNMQTDESSFKLNGESLLFPALKTNSTVSVYSLNGVLVFKKTIKQDGEYAFSLSNLNAGVYMVNVNGLTYKIVKR